jgi:hypothetical protein
MKNRISLYASLIIILIFIIYIIYDSSVSREVKKADDSTIANPEIADKWYIAGAVHFDRGQLKAVSVTANGEILAGGDSFVSCLNGSLKTLWNVKTAKPVTSLAVSGDTVFATSPETIMIIDRTGRSIGEWGPYDSNCILTSVSSGKALIAVADAGNKLVYLLNKKGELQTIIGQTGSKFIIPSPYFDVALTSENKLLIANTGERRIETWTTDGKFISYFGNPGIAPENFCGCCNPAHLTLLGDGIVTAEKGINRIKILSKEGSFRESVSSGNDFTASIPLDLAAFNDDIIYAANPADSKLYVFKKK